MAKKVDTNISCPKCGSRIFVVGSESETSAVIRCASCYDNNGNTTYIKNVGLPTLAMLRSECRIKSVPEVSPANHQRCLGIAQQSGSKEFPFDATDPKSGDVTSADRVNLTITAGTSVKQVELEDKPCTLCNGATLAVGNTALGIVPTTLKMENGCLNIVTHFQDGTTSYSFKVNYCPICGRVLK